MKEGHSKVTVHKNNVLNSLTLWLKTANCKYNTQNVPSAGKTNRNMSTSIQNTAVAGGWSLYMKLPQNQRW